MLKTIHFVPSVLHLSITASSSLPPFDWVYGRDLHISTIYHAGMGTNRRCNYYLSFIQSHITSFFLFYLSCSLSGTLYLSFPSLRSNYYPYIYLGILLRPLAWTSKPLLDCVWVHNL